MSSASSFNDMDQPSREAFISKLLSEGLSNKCVSVRAVEQENLHLKYTLTQQSHCFAQFVSSDLPATDSWVQEVAKQVKDFAYELVEAPELGTLEVTDRNGGPVSIDLATGAHALYFCANSVPLSLGLVPESLEVPAGVSFKVVSLDRNEDFEKLKTADARECLVTAGPEGFQSQVAKQLKLQIVPLLMLVNQGKVQFSGHPKLLDLQEDLKKLVSGETLSVNVNQEDEWTSLTSAERKEKFNAASAQIIELELVVLSQVQKNHNSDETKQIVSRVAAYGARPEATKEDVTNKLGGLSLGPKLENNVRFLSAEEINKQLEESKQ